MSASSSDAVDTTIFVFAKPPRAGVSKTRLAASVGDELAAEFAGACLRDVWDVAGGAARMRRVLAATDPDPSAYALPSDAPVVLQGEGELGDRMQRVLAAGLRDATFVLGVGTDCPGVDTTHFARARAALEAHDAYLGPTDDGGFYLIGLRVCPDGAFDGITWSVPTTLAATRVRFAELGLRVAIGPSWFDIDEGEDLRHLREHRAAIEAHAPRTAALAERLLRRECATHRPAGPTTADS